MRSAFPPYVATSLSAGALGIESFRGNARLGDHRPSAVTPSPEETAAPPGVAGHPLLIDQEQHGVAVAIEAQLTQVLNLSRRLPLAPQSGARTRPIAGAALG